MVSFCEAVILQKKVAEMDRERADPAWQRRTFMAAGNLVTLAAARNSTGQCASLRPRVGHCGDVAGFSL